MDDQQQPIHVHYPIKHRVTPPPAATHLPESSTQTAPVTRRLAPLVVVRNSPRDPIPSSLPLQSIQQKKIVQDIWEHGFALLQTKMDAALREALLRQANGIRDWHQLGHFNRATDTPAPDPYRFKVAIPLKHDPRTHRNMRAVVKTWLDRVVALEMGLPWHNAHNLFYHCTHAGAHEQAMHRNTVQTREWNISSFACCARLALQPGTHVQLEDPHGVLHVLEIPVGQVLMFRADVFRAGCASFVGDGEEQMCVHAHVAPAGWCVRLARVGVKVAGGEAEMEAE